MVAVGDVFDALLSTHLQVVASSSAIDARRWPGTREQFRPVSYNNDPAQMGPRKTGTSGT